MRPINSKSCERFSKTLKVIIEPAVSGSVCFFPIPTARKSHRQHHRFCAAVPEIQKRRS